MAKRIQKKERVKIILIFLILFNLLSIPMYLIMHFNLTSQKLQMCFATLATILLKKLNYPVVSEEASIFILEGNKIREIEVSWDSTAWKSMYALFSLTMASPIRGLYKKLRFLCVGIPTIFLANLLRIVVTISVSISYGFDYFELLHAVLWREFMIMILLGLWGTWLWREKDNIREYQFIFGV